MSEGGDEDRIDALERRMERIEERLARLDSDGFQDEEPESQPEEDPAPEPGPEPEPVQAEAESRTFKTESVAPANKPTTSASPEPSTPASSQSLEDRLGADWLAKAGMATLVLGVAFFLKYAFDNDWIGLTERVILGVLGGLAIWGAGEYLHQRRDYGVYPQILAGGGATITYFTLYAAYAFDDLRQATGMTIELDAILLGLTALGLAGYAVSREMPTLASLAALLGAGTGLIAESWEGFSVFYTVLLAGAVTAAALWRRWATVALIALVSAYAALGIELALDVDPTLVMVGTLLLLGMFVAAAWRVRSDRLEPAALGLVLSASLFATVSAIIGVYDTFAIIHLVLLALAVAPLALVRGTSTALTTALFTTFGGLAIGLIADLPAGETLWGALGLFVIFSTAAFAAARQDDQQTDGLAVPSLLAGGSLLASWGLIHWSLNIADVTGWHGPTAAGVAIAGIALAAIPATPRLAARGWITAGIIAALAWPPIQFDGSATVWVWALLTGIAAAWSLLQEETAGRIAAGAGTGLIGAHLFWIEAPNLFTDDLDGFAGLAVFAVGMIAAGLSWRAEARLEGEESGIAWTLLAVTLAIPIVYFGSALEGTWIPISWALTALVVVIVGFATDTRTLRLAAFGLFGVVLVRVFLYDLAALDVVYRIVTFLVVGAILLVASFLYARARGSESAKAS